MPIILAPGLSNDNMTDHYRASLDPASVEHQIRVAGSKLHLIGWSLYVSTLWCVKLCIAVFYTRLMYVSGPGVLRCLLTNYSDGLLHMMIHIRVAYVVIGVSYVAVMATILGACQPFHRHWQINPNPGGKLGHIIPHITIANFLLIQTIACLPPRW